VTKQLLEDIYALVVLHCDGYLSIKGDISGEKYLRCVRFLKITKRLPQELQMMICRRIFLSRLSLILSSQIETSLERVLSVPF